MGNLNMKMYATDAQVQKRTACTTLLVLIEGRKSHLPAQ